MGLYTLKTWLADNSGPQAFSISLTNQIGYLSSAPCPRCVCHSVTECPSYWFQGRSEFSSGSCFSHWVIKIIERKEEVKHKRVMWHRLVQNKKKSSRKIKSTINSQRAVHSRPVEIHREETSLAFHSLAKRWVAHHHRDVQYCEARRLLSIWGLETGEKWD